MQHKSIENWKNEQDSNNDFERKIALQLLGFQRKNSLIYATSPRLDELQNVVVFF